MFEIRLHGRGGQGVVLASTILATGLVEAGRYAVAIPSFGFERRGALVAALLRTDEKESRRRNCVSRARRMILRRLGNTASPWDVSAP